MTEQTHTNLGAFSGTETLDDETRKESVAQEVLLFRLPVGEQFVAKASSTAEDLMSALADSYVPVYKPFQLILNFDQRGSYTFSFKPWFPGHNRFWLRVSSIVAVTEVDPVLERAYLQVSTGITLAQNVPTPATQQ